MADVLFCPFCRESFEGLAACPEHGLRLVPFSALAHEEAQLDLNQPLPFWEIGYGRVWVMLGLALSLVGFFLPLARLSGDVTAASTLFALAQGRAKTLWLVPLAALGQLVVLNRRRSAQGMSSARISVLWLALLPPLVVGMTLYGVLSAATLMNEQARDHVTAHAGSGAYLVAAGAFLSIVGSVRLGRPPRRRPVSVETVH